MLDITNMLQCDVASYGGEVDSDGEPHDPMTNGDDTVSAKGAGADGHSFSNLGVALTS